jgi:hypothetical protein
MWRTFALACVMLSQACGGTAFTRMNPVELDACAGSWSAEWYDGGVDRGVGTVRIGADGAVDGLLRDDAYNSAEWNQAVGAFLKGRVERDGSFLGSISWSSGRAGWNLVGQLGSNASGDMRLDVAPPGGVADPGRTITVILRRLPGSDNDLRP